MQHWRSPSASASVNKVDSGNRRSFQPTQRRKGPGKRGKFNSSGSNIKDPSECLSCGKTGHPRSQCKYGNYTRYSCDKVRHILEACNGKPQKVHQLEGSEPLKLVLPMIRLILFLSRYRIWTQVSNLSSNRIRLCCRRLSHFRRNLQAKPQWHTPHAVQYSPTCIHRTHTQGTRASYCTP